ncbi:Auxin response factor [Arachis hypogaea]|nr:Auxin response factor [Arachis hypogaea]
MQLVLDLKLQPSSTENGNGMKMYKRSIENVAGFGFEKACRKLFGLCDVKHHELTVLGVAFLFFALIMCKIQIVLSGSSLGSSPDDNSSDGIKLDEMEYGNSGLLMAIHYRADPYTDEVFAQIALLSEQSQDENAVEKEPPLAPR